MASLYSLTLTQEQRVKLAKEQRAKIEEKNARFMAKRPPAQGSKPMLTRPTKTELRRKEMTLMRMEQKAMVEQLNRKEPSTFRMSRRGAHAGASEADDAVAAAAAAAAAGGGGGDGGDGGDGSRGGGAADLDQVPADADAGAADYQARVAGDVVRCRFPSVPSQHSQGTTTNWVFPAVGNPRAAWDRYLVSK